MSKESGNKRVGQGTFNISFEEYEVPDMIISYESLKVFVHLVSIESNDEVLLMSVRYPMEVL